MTTDVVGTVTIERISRADWDWFWEPDSNIAWENLDWRPVRTIEMTVENRGAAARLTRRERLIWGDLIVDGDDYDWVEVRVWHDGSTTVEGISRGHGGRSRIQ